VAAVPGTKKIPRDLNRYLGTQSLPTNNNNNNSLVCIATVPWAGQPRIGVRVPVGTRVSL
jgi:hypothetical protein